MQQRWDNMAPKIERMKLSRTGSIIASKHQIPQSELDDRVQTYINGVGTIADGSVYQPDTDIMDPTAVPGSTHEESVRDDEEYDEGEDDDHRYLTAHTRGLADDYMAGAGNDSPGRQFLEEEPYKLRMKTGPGSAVGAHKTWEVARGDGDFDYEGDGQAAVTDPVGYARNPGPHHPSRFPFPSPYSAIRSPPPQRILAFDDTEELAPSFVSSEPSARPPVETVDSTEGVELFLPQNLMNTGVGDDSDASGDTDVAGYVRARVPRLHS